MKTLYHVKDGLFNLTTHPFNCSRPLFVTTMVCLLSPQFSVMTIYLNGASTIKNSKKYHIIFFFIFFLLLSYVITNYYVAFFLEFYLCVKRILELPIYIYFKSIIVFLEIRRASFVMGKWSILDIQSTLLHKRACTSQTKILLRDFITLTLKGTTCFVLAAVHIWYIFQRYVYYSH